MQLCMSVLGVILRLTVLRTSPNKLFVIKVLIIYQPRDT